MSASAPQGQSNHPSDDQTSTVIGIACMVIVLCSAAVGGRFLSRWMVKARIEVDDYVTLVALVSTTRGFCTLRYAQAGLVSDYWARGRAILSYATLKYWTAELKSH